MASNEDEQQWARLVLVADLFGQSQPTDRSRLAVENQDIDLVLIEFVQYGGPGGQLGEGEFGQVGMKGGPDGRDDVLAGARVGRIDTDAQRDTGRFRCGTHGPDASRAWSSMMTQWETMPSLTRPRAAVVGGGICGLAAAVALTRRGWDVVVFEETPSVVVGAGITIWSNGIAVLTVLGVADGVRALANDMPRVRILQSSGRELMRQCSAPGEMLALHRRDLNAALVDGLDDGVVRPATRATVVDVRRGIVAADGREESFNLVVAADGVHSQTRLQWWPEAGGERDCGIRAWRAVVDGATDEAINVWGSSGECGILPLPGDTTYVFGASRGRAREKGLAHFDGWIEPVPAMLAAIGEPIVHDLTELAPVRSPVKGRTVLVGDAAHAMRPHLGQGAGLSLEDAVVLAQHCTSSGEFDGVGFTAARRRRWATVAWMARRATPMMMPANRFAGLPQTFASILPDRMMLSLTDRIASWRPN